MRMTLASCLLLAAVVAPGGVAAQGAGFIEGKLIYPSDGLPADLQVCANNLDMGTTSCTSRHIRSPAGWGYRLGVPAGLYHVFASTRQMPGYRAYYSDFVLCGMNVSCTSHAPIEVEVRPGEATGNIDPGDWYNQ